MVLKLAEIHTSSAMLSNVASADPFSAIILLLQLVGVLAVIIFIRLKAVSMDEERMKAYFQERGGKLIHSDRDEDAQSLLGKPKFRIHWIRYEDRDGNLHVARCKTSMFSGVYLTDDKIIRYGKPHEASPTALADLQAENQRLKDEIDRLQRLQPGWMPPGTSSEQWS